MIVSTEISSEYTRNHTIICGRQEVTLRHVPEYIQAKYRRGRRMLGDFKQPSWRVTVELYK